MFEVLIVNVNHRSLPQAPSASCASNALHRRGHEPGRDRAAVAFEPSCIVVRIAAASNSLRHLCVLLAVLLAGEALAQLAGRPHRGSPPKNRREPRVSTPCFVPQKNHVGLDRQHFFHDCAPDRRRFRRTSYWSAAASARDPVCRHASAPVAAFDLEQRHGAVHRVFRQRIRVEIDRMCDPERITA